MKLLLPLILVLQINSSDYAKLEEEEGNSDDDDKEPMSFNRMLVFSVNNNNSLGCYLIRVNVLMKIGGI